MSFSLTTEQMRNQTKTVTRRIGWHNLKPGEIVNACVKCQGLKKGEKIEVIGQILIVANEVTRLSSIEKPDVVSEGFPDLSPSEFVAMFCKSMKCQPSQIVRRIEFKFV